MKKVLICAALPRELKYILEGLRERKRQVGPARVVFFGSESCEFFLLMTGIGVQNSETSIRSLLRTLRPDMIVSLGFAGALYEGLSAGDLIWASRVFLMLGQNANSSEVLVPASQDLAGRLAGKIPLREGCIVTLTRFMKKPELIRILPEGLLLPVCDMETFVLAKIAAEQSISFFAARAVTDTSEEEIPPEFLDISCPSGRTRLSVLLMQVICKPWLLRDVIRLKRSSEKAAKSLASLAWAIVDEFER